LSAGLNLQRRSQALHRSSSGVAHVAKALLLLGRGPRSKNDGAVYEWMFSGGLTQHGSPVAPPGPNGLRSRSSHLVSSRFKKLNVDQDRPDPRNYDNRDFLPQRHEPNLTPFSAFIGGRSLGCVANFSVSVMAVYVNIILFVWRQEVNQSGLKVDARLAALRRG
jgi:hypothetical protein